jgi:cell division transport system permease protein
MAISIEYVAKETASNLWRNRVMAIAAILTVAISLSLVGTALLLRQAVSRQIGQWSNNVSLQIFLQPDITTPQLAAVNQRIDQLKGSFIKHCNYLDHEQSYQQMRQLFAGVPSVLGVLTPATTPPVFSCQLVNPNEAKTVADSFDSNVPGIYKATFPGQSVKILQQVTNVLQLILLVIAIVLLISSLVLILDAIRMAIFARRREVSVMKLVGATNWFIRVPFMLEGLVQGLLGGVVAVGIVALSNIGVNSLITHYNVKVLSSSSLPTGQLVLTEVLVLIVGAVIGMVGSSLAVRQFLEV